MIINPNMNRKTSHPKKENLIKKKNKSRKKNKNSKNKISLNNINISNNIITGNFNSSNNKLKLSISEKNKNNWTKKIMNYNNDEKNSLPYNLALIYDKRKYCQYYSDLLKVKHDLIFSFCGDDYNPKIIKIDLFFIRFTINYVVNALFFDDKTMHKIYVNKGSFDLETQIPITIYSSLISIVLGTLLSLLALSNDNIINFKQNKLRKGILKREEKLRFLLETKFILYFILGFLFLCFFGIILHYLELFIKILNIIY